ncbi:50S ribosomal protein L21, chloroplastic [Cynara cardunculus var. scolymus]|uniref:50S ribosomal protein L21, chloroplastic n=1 Tax=Cynara cardunculus var. scolymus TaxID=59895 RepID=UPI000D625970|nr:50S ribosomal protein L21, chloroplastic [Cynara cardunculus var. scolymus]
MAMSFSCPSSSCSPSITSIFTHKTYAPITATTFNFTCNPPHSSISSLQFTTPSYHRPSSSSRIVPKLSQTEPSTLVSEDEVSEPEQPESAEETLSTTEPKGEEVFAVVMIGGRQYIVFPGRFLYTQRLKGANVDDKIILNKVLLVGTKTSTYIGKPVVPNAAVHAVVEEQGLDPKVVVFKYKKKKNYRRNIGHRQPNTRIRILGITGYQDSPAATLP